MTTRQGIASKPILIMIAAVVLAGFVTYLNFTTPKGKVGNDTNVTANTSAYVNANTTANTNTVAAVNTNVSTNTNTATDATKGWKTYANTTLGITLKHPSSWYPHEQTNTTIFLKTAELPTLGATEGYAYGTQFSVHKNSLNEIKDGVKTKEQFLKEVVGTKDLDGNIIVQENVKRNGLDMIRVAANAYGSDGKVLSYYVFDGKNVYTLSNYPYNATSEDSKVFESVVTTFAVTDPTADLSAGQAGWKTYTNTKYGFSFKYPNDSWTLSESKQPYGSASYDSVGFTKKVTPTTPSGTNVVSKFIITMFPRNESESALSAYQQAVAIDLSTTTKSTIKIAGIEGTKVTGIPAFVSYNGSFIAKGSFAFEIDQGNGLSDEQYTQILSTFTFTK